MSGYFIKQFFSAAFLLLLITAVGQGQSIINEDNDLRIIVNNTANFAVTIYRELGHEKSPPSSTPTPGLPSSSLSPTTTPKSTQTPAIPSETGRIVFSIIAIKEVDANSIPISESGYSVSREELMARSYTPKLPSYQAALSDNGSVQADCYQYNANPVNGVTPKGALNITICSISNNGTISRSTDSGGPASVTVQVTAGQVWMRVGVASWTWCTNCATTGQVNVSGAYLNVDMEVTVNKQRKMENTDLGAGKPARISLGPDAFADISKLVQVDASQTQMKAGFPTLAFTDGNWKGIVTIPLTKFPTSGTFRMIVDPGYQQAPKDGGVVVGGATKMAAVSSFLIGCSVILEMLLAVSLAR